MTSGAFEPGRLRLARELSGLSQLELARRVDLTAPSISQFEAGTARPSPSTQSRLANVLAVPSRFLELPMQSVHEGFFRSLRRTAVAERRVARAIAHIAHDVATLDPALGDWPLLAIPQSPVSLDEDEDNIEQVAMTARRAMGVGPGPVPDLVDLLERQGVVVIRLPLLSADVDAFSLPFTDHPVVVLSANKNDRARSRFDASHELGHLVMHRESVWGLAAVEKQAHRFSSAYLMPRDEIIDELPDRADWPRLFALKRRWQVSIATLLLRARVLGRMAPSTYLSAVKAISLRGWRRVEPVPLGDPERPRLFERRVAQAEQDGIFRLLPESIVQALAAAV